MITELRGLPLLDLAIAHIEANPEEWDQDDFRCGTGMCVGGWICELAGGKWLSADVDGPFAWYLHADDGDPAGKVGVISGQRAILAHDRASRLIGAPRFTDLRHDRAVLFDGGNTLDDIKRIRDLIAADLAAGTS